ncbi:MAG: T9SS type A sorting domain-containing protein [Bacteroidaceae bacterium]|nr:T9SS type A sorting domain-containing protein [Bacteroidaceae bacterium]
MKMIKLTQVFLTVWITLSVLTAFSQEGVVSPACWLRTDSIRMGDEVWRDVSNHGLHATPQSGLMPDTMARLNFNPCILLNDGMHFSVQLDSLQACQADVIVVYETCDSTAENALWQLRIDSAKRVGQTTRRILNDNGQIIYDSTNRMKPVINYLAQSWRNNGYGAAQPSVSTLDIGMADSLPLNGKMAEVLYFDHRISDTAVIQWISYLAVKYGITLSQTDYLDSRKNVIWDYTNYPDYCGTIAGLGRDDSTSLFQKQTYFADGQIIMGFGSLANTNEENPEIIADGDFLIMGMQTFDNEENAGDSIPLLLEGVAEGRGSDGTAPWPISTLYIQSGETYEVIGQSMMQATGVVSTYNTFLWLDTNAVKDTVVPVLMIDRSGSGDYPAWGTDMIWPFRNDSLGYFVYDNVHWDTDLNGRDAFCFAVRIPEEEATPRMATANPIPLLLEGVAEGRGSDADVTAKPYLNEEKHSLQQVPENQATSTYRLLPNPNHGRFTVEINYSDPQDVIVTIYASDGKKIQVMSGKGQSNYRFEGQMKTSGHYLIDIISASERKQLKMVVN